jgi:hypothetical protein
MDPAVLDDIIRRLTEVRSASPGNQVQLSEGEIKQLCVASKKIFIQQRYDNSSFYQELVNYGGFGFTKENGWTKKKKKEMRVA